MRILAWVLTVLVASAACATTQAPDRLTVATRITERAGIDTKGLPTPGRSWTSPPGTSLADGLTIDEAVGIALWNNPDFQVALASLGLARADLVDAGLLRNPVFSLLFPWGPKQLEFTLTWPIDALWLRPKRMQAARLNADAVAEQLAANGLRVIADVRLAFFEVLVADRRLTLATEQAGVAGEAAKLAEGRLRAGDISEFEARLARADAVRLEAARLTGVATRDLAVVRLRVLLGLEADAPAFALVEPALTTAEGCAEGPGLLQAAMAARPEVRAAELQIEAAGARAGVERARILALTASLDANAKGSEGFEMGPGVVVELPVLSQNQGGRARATAEVEQAARRYVAVRATVAAEIGAAMVTLTQARNTARLLSDDVAASLSAARQQAERLYSAGEISLLDLLLTRQRLIDIEATRVDAVFGVNRAIVRLEQAIGRTCAPR
ncbi:MAG TPA: TolC family protein [Vicinamibacterales bacterium]|nr:TolC family protein [Vicinamibacterales bacterium]